RALTKERDGRFASMADMMRALEAAVPAAERASSDDVAAFLKEHLGDRGEKRRAAIKEALRVADDRATTRKSLPGGPASGRGREGTQGDVSSPSMPSFSTGGTASSPSLRSGPPSGPSSVSSPSGPSTPSSPSSLSSPGPASRNGVRPSGPGPSAGPELD